MEGGTGLRNTGFMNWPECRLSEYSVHLVQRGSQVIEAAGVDVAHRVLMSEWPRSLNSANGLIPS